MWSRKPLCLLSSCWNSLGETRCKRRDCQALQGLGYSLDVKGCWKVAWLYKDLKLRLMITGAPRIEIHGHEIVWLVLLRLYSRTIDKLFSGSFLHHILKTKKSAFGQVSRHKSRVHRTRKRALSVWASRRLVKALGAVGPSSLAHSIPARSTLATQVFAARAAGAV